jgi:tetratricopeptide (TPR) repeat protein
MKKTVLSLIIFLFSSLFLSISSYAQFESRGEKYNKEDAEAFYNTGYYFDALPLYEILIAENPEKLEYQFKAGICHLNLSQSPEKAIISFKWIYDEKPKTENVLYFLARAYALNYKFELAIDTYKDALEASSTTSDKKLNIPLLIEQCENGIALMKKPLSVNIINMGELINSSGNEYSPSIDEEETILIFTYEGIKSEGGRQNDFGEESVNGNYADDIYKSEYIKNSWTQSVSLDDSLNTNLNEGSISITENGNKLYLYKDTKEFSGDIFESVKEGEVWSEPKRLSINSKYWEGHVSINSVGDEMIFSSDRPGGFGKQDLYSAKLQDDGTWGEIKNLGSMVNTSQNEDAPFFHSDDTKLNFSSDGNASMGGYDIFEVTITDDTIFSAPENMGYPINTSSNDLFYCTSKKGNVYLSSARKGGYGQNDIYKIIYEGIVMEGTVVYDDESKTPMSNLVVSIMNKAKTFTLTDTTDNQGKYRFSNLEPDDYELFFIDAKDNGLLDEMVFLTDGQVTKMGKAQKNLNINKEQSDGKGNYSMGLKIKPKSVDELSEDELEEKYGDQTAEELYFVIQVAALRNPKYFEGKNLETFGDVDRLVLDGLTRFTVGKLKNLKEANDLLHRVVAAGVDDAFVLMFKNGKRTYLQDLVDDGTFK